MPNSKLSPIWNIPLKHPVNLAYEAATADLNDVNMIDPFHLEAYGKQPSTITVTWNFPCCPGYVRERSWASALTNLLQIWA